MYSVVLMMALSGGTDAVDFGHRGGGCGGGYGCSGVAYSSCYGSGYGGCSGSSYGCGGGYGCSGGRHHGHRHHRGGSCCGSSYTSCYGGGYVSGGCYGSSYVSGGCYGSSYGGGYVSGGCYGSGYGTGFGVGGCLGGSYGAPVYGAPTTTPGSMQPAPLQMPAPGAAPTTNPPEKKIDKTTDSSDVSAPATIVVSLPADANLTVDGNATSSTSARRTLVTPAIARDADAVYTLRATVVRDGQTQVQTQQVTVRGGQTTAVPFSFTTSTVASR